MMLKTVYGPPASNAERIEAAETEEDSCVRETKKTGTALEDLKRDRQLRADDQ